MEVFMSWIPLGLCLLGAAFIAYVLAGYPLLLAVLSRYNEKPVRRNFQARTVSILLPVWNGEAFLGAKLESIARLDYPAGMVETIIVSDGSTDATEQIAASWTGEQTKVIVIQKSGKAMALNAAMKEAGGEILFFTDVRQRLHPACLRSLVECFGDPGVGVASGELIILSGERQEEANVGLYWRYEKWIRERLSRIDSVIGATGAIYAMRRELAVPLPPGTLLDDVFLPLAAFFRGYRVILDRYAWAYDYPVALHSEFRRKLRTLAGNYQLLRFYPQLLSSRNRMWIHFISHKLARLFLPHAMLLIAVATFWLQEPYRKIMLCIQGLFYGAALLDTLIPEGFALKRITSLVRTFVVLQAAALSALLLLVARSQQIWKPTKVKARPR